MNMQKKTSIWVLAGLFLLAGCGGGTGTSSGGADGGTENDPVNLDGDPAAVSISLRLTQGSLGSALTQALSLETSDEGGASLNVTDAWVNVESIELKLPDGMTCADVDITLPDFATCENEGEDDSDDAADDSDDTADDSDDEDDTQALSSLDEQEGAEIEFEGPFVVDLINGTVTPSLDDLVVPSGIIRRIDVKIDDTEEDAVLPDGAPATLLGNSLAASGTVTLNGVDTPFSMAFDFGEEMRFEDLTGLTVSEAVDVNQIILSFDVDAWFSGIDIQSCVDDDELDISNGVILLDEGSGDCSDIENTIKDNVKDSGVLIEDDDDDEGEEDEDDDDEEEDDSDDDDSV